MPIEVDMRGRGLGQSAAVAGAGIGDQSGAVATLQEQNTAKIAASNGPTVVPDSSSTSSSSPAPTTVSTDTTNAQLIAGQNSNKVQTLSTSSTNALLYGIGALAVGGVIAVAIARSRRGRRRRR